MPPVLDTDILSELIRARNRSVVERAIALRRALGRLTTIVITVTEVVKGYRQIDRSDLADTLVAGLWQWQVLPLDTTAAALGGRIAGDLRRLGRPIGDFDPLIAAIAITNDLPLATGNTKHYQRIVDLGYDLKLDNWREPASG